MSSFSLNALLSATVSDGSTKEIKIDDFKPGTLTLSDSDYVFLTSNNTASIRLKFEKTLFSGKDRVDRQYDID